MLKILFPTDFSANAQETLDQYYPLFDAKNTTFILFHAIVPPKSVGGAFVSIEKQMVEMAQEEMAQEIKRIEAKHSVKLESLCRFGFLQDTLSIGMRQTNAKLIIMCSKGESNLESKIFGSNASHCLRNTAYPILISPPKKSIKFANFLYASEDGYLKGNAFLTLLFKALNNQSITLEKIYISQEKTDIDTDINEQFMGKTLKLHTAIDSSISEGVNTFLAKHPKDMVIVNSKNKAWYDYLFNYSITKKLAAALELPILSLPNLSAEK